MIKTFLLGIGILAAGKYLGRGRRAGLGRFMSLGSLAAIIAGAAATRLLERQPPMPKPSPSPGE